MEHDNYRFALLSDVQLIRSELDEEGWIHLARLLEFSCTKPEWILLSFAAGTLTRTLVLAAPHRFNVPLEIICLHGGSDMVDALRLFQLAIGKAQSLGACELYCSLPENCPETSVLSAARFCRWRKVVQFECDDPVDLEVPGYRSVEASHFERAQIISLIEKTSQHSPDIQIEYYRQRLGGIADAEMTLQMIESMSYDPSWWRVALTPEGDSIGVILPVIAFGKATIGFIGVVPAYRGRSIASFLLAEAWSVLKPQGHSILFAEADEKNLSMHRALTKNHFGRRAQFQEWRLELPVQGVNFTGAFGG